MKTATVILASAALASAADERILGAYIFHRHGDRTAKAWAPVNLTALGADEAHASGTFYHDRYVDSSSKLRIAGLSSDEVVLSQLSVVSAEDAVLHNSADTFLQGFYPPTGIAYTLRNGSKVTAPLDGYQYIPIDAVATAATSSKAEDNGWLQGSSGCDKGVASSNEYFTTSEYHSVLDDTKSFYQSLLPVINTTYGAAAANFKNGYTSMSYLVPRLLHPANISQSLTTSMSL